ncbi:SAVMC3_10250 family protein [Streptomyces sp. NPDC046994]|uniref:SAVMC3_10250 family protein n=1 Tax=Streptomyces sp. NPDC046994 TaxID=3155735 RepID=UPI0034566306
MRELVYLSDKKLGQFVPQRRRGRIGRRLTALRFTTPAGGLELEAAGDPDTQRQKQEHLALVIRHIEERALWFQDPDARAGQWIYFEAPLNVLASEEQPDTIMFLDPEPGEVEGYEQPHGARLLLHGSRSHLLIGDVGSVPLPVVPFSRSLWNVTQFALRLLSSVSPPTAEDLQGHDPDLYFGGVSVPLQVEHTLSDLIFASQFVAGAWSAAWMRGYARVSATLAIHGLDEEPSPCLLATPLFVEHANDVP